MGAQTLTDFFGTYFFANPCFGVLFFLPATSVWIAWIGPAVNSGDPNRGGGLHNAQVVVCSKQLHPTDSLNCKEHIKSSRISVGGREECIHYFSWHLQRKNFQDLVLLCVIIHEPLAYLRTKHDI